MNEQLIKKIQKRRDINIVFRILHLFWGNDGGPSKEYRKTHLQNMTGLSPKSFNNNLEWLISDGFLSVLFNSDGHRIYRITKKGVNIHNMLEEPMSFLGYPRDDIGTNSFIVQENMK